MVYNLQPLADGGDSDSGVKDQIWDQVIEQLRETDSFKRSDLEIEAANETVRRTLRAMEEMGYLSRESSEGHLWYKGEKARKIFGETPQGAVGDSRQDIQEG